MRKYNYDNSLSLERPLEPHQFTFSDIKRINRDKAISSLDLADKQKSEAFIDSIYNSITNELYKPWSRNKKIVNIIFDSSFYREMRNVSFEKCFAHQNYIRQCIFGRLYRNSEVPWQYGGDVLYDEIIFYAKPSFIRKIIYNLKRRKHLCS